ncbi:MAG: glycosyltransferase, partial [Candidatus Cloacimonetes bacterium]|nr:glycosyltransferase [Candidatus Cloacimonadota bacterium]
MIKAAKILQDKKVDVKIIMITGGKLFNKYNKMIKKMSLKDIEIKPLVPQNVLYEKLLDADMYVSCSLSDGLSICLLEAFAAGLYPVVSDIEANRNVITHGQNGSLFQTGSPNSLTEEITKIITQAEKIQKAIVRNKRWVKKYQT